MLLCKVLMGAFLYEHCSSKLVQKFVVLHMVCLEKLGTLYPVFKAVWTNSTAACMNTGVVAAMVGITLR
jgi:hypothetical protein